MAKASVRVDEGKLLLVLSDETGQVGTYRFDATELSRLILEFFEAVKALPADAAALGLGSGVGFVAWPSAQVGVAPSGDVSIIFRVEPLPPMEFRFSDEGAKIIQESIETALSAPKESRYPRKIH